jgi:hypothetical protein
MARVANSVRIRTQSNRLREPACQRSTRGFSAALSLSMLLVMLLGMCER